MSSANKTYHDPMADRQKITNFILRTLMSFIGIGILSLGIAFLREANLGVDPYSAFNIGLANDLHSDLGTIQLISNLIIVVIVFFVNRHMIGLGTIMNMILVGYEIQWFTSIYHNIFPNVSGVFAIITNLVIGVILFTLGTSLYMAPKLGVAPYDAIAPIISNLLHKPYKIVRVIQDITCLILAFLVGGPIGPISIILAFFAGPLISYWTRKVSEPIALTIDNISKKPTFHNAKNNLTSATKKGYHSVRSAYNTTLDVHAHKDLNQYSQKELQSELKDVTYHMQLAQKYYLKYKQEYENLQNKLEHTK